MSTINVNLMADSQGGSVAPISSVMRNRIINGAMTIDQRNAGASVTLNGSESYITDRFACGDVTDGSFTAQQVTDAPTGFINSLKCTITSADTSLATTQTAYCYQTIEGLNISDLGWGTANAKTVTLSFWVKSSLTGTFGGGLRNSAANRSYPFSYSISSANTWEQKSITITGDTTGTWLTTNGAGINLQFSLGAGSDRTGTSGSWNANNNVGATGQVQVIGTSGATFYITGVQLEKGTQATGFEYRQIGTELALCQRYYAKLGAGGYSNFCAFAVGFAASSTNIEAYIKYPVTMRAAATLNFSNVRTNAASGGSGAITSLGTNYAGTDSMNASFNATSATMTTGQGATIIGNNNSSAFLELSAEL